jgi:hypothetical protein
VRGVGDGAPKPNVRDRSGHHGSPTNRGARVVPGRRPALEQLPVPTKRALRDPRASQPETRYHDLGADFYDNRIPPEREKRTHVRQLGALGYEVTLEAAA